MQAYAVASSLELAAVRVHELDMMGRGLDRGAAQVIAQSRSEQMRHWAQARQGLDGAKAPGLVSVPTSPERASEEAVSARVAAERDELADTLECFAIDKAKRRLALLRRSVGFAARCHAITEKGHRSDVPWMVTLTYAPGQLWSSRHVSDALRAMYHWCKRKGIPFRYVWIAEIQDGKRRADGKGRDCIHYHIVVWLPVGVRCPHFDRRGWWPYGMSRSDAPQKVGNAVGYLLHYLKKDKNLAAMPKGARAYGVGGLDHASRRARRWLGLPAFVQANSDISDQWRRAEGGGWISPSGRHYASEFRRVVLAGVEALQRVCTHTRAIAASGPFCWLSRGGVSHA
ncbi:rolling circle replication-associated protein [Kinneretia aquatilis]|uniref:rolling circle replication-associated protein n=1 Tax=Kinneretia aquatilis TaxID=2070761 RepID=UPI0010575984|nr:hypothetical protein [Paucibacter aquatile]